jgi:hypothetical protein
MKSRILAGVLALALVAPLSSTHAMGDDDEPDQKLTNKKIHLERPRLMVWVHGLKFFWLTDSERRRARREVRRHSDPINCGGIAVNSEAVSAWATAHKKKQDERRERER